MLLRLPQQERQRVRLLRLEQLGQVMPGTVTAAAERRPRRAVGQAAQGTASELFRTNRANTVISGPTSSWPIC